MHNRIPEKYFDFLISYYINKHVNAINNYKWMSPCGHEIIQGKQNNHLPAVSPLLLI